MRKPLRSHPWWVSFYFVSIPSSPSYIPVQRYILGMQRIPYGAKESAPAVGAKKRPTVFMLHGASWFLSVFCAKHTHAHTQALWCAARPWSFVKIRRTLFPWFLLITGTYARALCCMRWRISKLPSFFDFVFLVLDTTFGLAVRISSASFLFLFLKCLLGCFTHTCARCFVCRHPRH